MSKLAALRNVSVLLVNQTSTKVKTEHGALLRPALSTKSWLDNVNTRLVVFRDFLPTASGQSTRQNGRRDVRIVGIVKHGGTFYESLEKVVPFAIDKVRISVV